MLLRKYGAGVVFLAIALVAALFGFGVVSDDDPLAAKLCAAFFFLVAVAAFGWAWLNRARPVVGRAPSRSVGAGRPWVGDGVRRRG